MFVGGTNTVTYELDGGCPEHASCRGPLEGRRHSPLPWYTTRNSLNSCVGP